MTTALPVPLSGDELRVPCLDGGQRRYLSFDTAAATGALPTVLDAVQAFTPWYASMRGRAGYKSQASAIAYESARLAALTFAGRGTSADDAAVFYRSGPLGTLWAMQAVFPHMRAQGWGRIVNVGSAAGIVGLHGYGAYNMSKEAIRALTRTAAREWGPYGIVVNCFCPGAASKRGTEGTERAAQQGRTLVMDRPIDRLGDPEDDIAPVVLFLCSDACRYLTGQTFMVDGGAFLFA